MEYDLENNTTSELPQGEVEDIKLIELKPNLKLERVPDERFKRRSELMKKYNLENVDQIVLSGQSTSTSTETVTVTEAEAEASDLCSISNSEPCESTNGHFELELPENYSDMINFNTESEDEKAKVLNAYNVLIDMPEAAWNKCLDGNSGPEKMIEDELSPVAEDHLMMDSSTEITETVPLSDIDADEQSRAEKELAEYVQSCYPNENFKNN